MSNIEGSPSPYTPPQYQENPIADSRRFRIHTRCPRGAYRDDEVAKQRSASPPRFPDREKRGDSEALEPDPSGPTTSSDGEKIPPLSLRLQKSSKLAALQPNEALLLVRTQVSPSLEDRGGAEP